MFYYTLTGVVVGWVKGRATQHTRVHVFRPSNTLCGLGFVPQPNLEKLLLYSILMCLTLENLQTLISIPSVHSSIAAPSKSA